MGSLMIIKPSYLSVYIYISGTLVLIDGFPRSLQNAVDFHENFGNADGVLAFECPDQEMVRRTT